LGVELSQQADGLFSYWAEHWQSISASKQESEKFIAELDRFRASLRLELQRLP